MRVKKKEKKAPVSGKGKVRSEREPKICTGKGLNSFQPSGTQGCVLRQNGWCGEKGQGERLEGGKTQDVHRTTKIQKSQEQNEGAWLQGGTY